MCKQPKGRRFKPYYSRYSSYEENLYVCKEKTELVDIPKKYGKIMIKEHPDLVVRTCHKRHYYMVDNVKAWKIFNKIKLADSGRK